MTAAAAAQDGGLADWVGPNWGSPGPEGLVSPLIGAAVLAAVVWRLAAQAVRRRDREESDE